MSAYGNISAPFSDNTLPLTAYGLKNNMQLALFPLVNLQQTPPALVSHLYDIFRAEIDDGRTYPQQSCNTQKEFTSYFFAANSQVVVGVIVTGDEISDGVLSDQKEVSEALEVARAGREWREVLGGFYYIKPNYPGRSSHICNGGFMVPSSSRGLRVGVALGKSYLIYAPMLGYRSSVFNLVFKNNKASLRIWDQLGFQRVGLIPEAGLLNKVDGSGKEYVDAVVVYKKFD